MTYQEEFIRFMVDSGVLTFGDFTLKSGRKSPFFMNAGAYTTGTQLRSTFQEVTIGGNSRRKCKDYTCNFEW